MGATNEVAWIKGRSAAAGRDGSQDTLRRPGIDRLYACISKRTVDRVKQPKTAV
jgi:hypothetical protein